MERLSTLLPHVLFLLVLLLIQLLKMSTYSDTDVVIISATRTPIGIVIEENVEGMWLFLSFCAL